MRGIATKQKIMGIISGNTQHGGGKNRGYAESWTREQLDGLLSEAWLKEMVTAIRAGDEKKKDQLPYICPHYAQFKDNHRAQKDIIPEAFTHMTCVDVDDKSLVEQAVQRALEVNEDEYSDWQDQVLRIEYSARRKVHIYIRIPKGKTIEEAQQAFCKEIGVPYDESCITPERFIYVTGKDEEVYRSPHWLEALSDEELEERREAYLQRGLDVDGRKASPPPPLQRARGVMCSETENSSDIEHQPSNIVEPSARTLAAFDETLAMTGLDLVTLNRDGVRHNTLKLLLPTLCQMMAQEELIGVLAQKMPEYSQEQDCRTLVKNFYEKYVDQNRPMNMKQKEIFLKSLRAENYTSDDSQLSTLFATPHSQRENAQLIEDDDSSFFTLHSSLKKMPQGVRDSIEAVGPQLAMPALVAVAPVIGMLATGVRLDVHGVKNTLNLIAYVAGDFASGKGSIDPIVAAWTSELRALEKVYQQQEDEWRARKRAAKNKKEQPEEPKLPVRLLTLNNTVANLAERLANTDGKHAFSFTPEADTVAQKWKSTINDFSVMLRQSYDGSPYDREARSAEAVNVHIDHLLWNVLMCGTPDALYRVVNNYTDGFQSRIAVARTPDNTYTRLEDKPYVLTDRQAERIRQVAHLLPLMQGEVVLPKLEQKGREWLEQVRIECIKSDDKVRARQRFRVCVTAQRMVCCILLCKVAEQLIAKHGYSGAEKELKTHPDVWKAMLLKLQTPQLLEAYDVIADYLLDCALYFFRDRIEMAFNSRDYVGGSKPRQRLGMNDSIYERLDVDFGFDAALQHSISVKGSGVTRNQVQQMLKNWKIQGLIVQTERGRYRKVQADVS